MAIATPEVGVTVIATIEVGVALGPEEGEGTMIVAVLGVGLRERIRGGEGDLHLLPGVIRNIEEGRHQQPHTMIAGMTYLYPRPTNQCPLLTTLT